VDIKKALSKENRSKRNSDNLYPLIYGRSLSTYGYNFNKKRNVSSNVNQPEKQQNFLKKSKLNKQNFTNFMLNNVVQESLPTIENKTMNANDFLSSNGIKLNLKESIKNTKEQSTGNALSFLNSNGIKFDRNENSEESEQSTIVDDSKN